MNKANKKGTNSRTGLEIAVIGMAGRFPGAKNIAEFWENLKNGVESLAFLSDQELEEAGIDLELLKHPNYVKAQGGVLEGKEYFDAFFFDYTPAEAMLMDPQIRIFHECTWEALEDAGYDPSTYENYIGLYAGSAPGWNWGSMAFPSDTARELGGWETLHLSDKDFLPTRVSHKLDLKGPAVVIQTACSTALTAVHIACRALLTGDCHMALAGGVSVTPGQEVGYLYQEGMILSPDGCCRAFDAKSKGTVGGNGIGIVVLKPLSAAISDGDHIYAVIKGSAINNDGIRRAGFTAPGVSGQSEVIRAALRFAGVDPESIGYIEAHGTGTVLGDQIEVQALKKAFSTNRKEFCAIGSVKTNIGHLGPAAGAAGIIKTVLALKYKLIPPSLHFEAPNLEIDFKNSPFYVNTALSTWKNDHYPLRAGISSFGIGGTNAHVILEQVLEGTRGLAPLPDAHPAKDYQLILLSAKTQSALDKMTKNLVEYFKHNRINHDNHENPVNPGLTLADAAYTLQVGRKALQYKQMVACADVEEAINILSNPNSRKLHRSYSQGGNIPVVFMFTGLGSQYVNMGLELYQTEPLFREEMDHCFEIIRPLLGYDIKNILYPASMSAVSNANYVSKINRIEVAQVVIFIFAYSLARLLIHWGIKPHAMIGYSFGEYAAACVSGVLSLEDTLKLVVCRGKLLKKIPPGGMLSVPLTKEKLNTFLENQYHELSTAIDNGSSCLAAGPNDALAAFEKELKKHRYICMRVPSSRALHSKMMDPILKEFEDNVRNIPLYKPQIPYISNVTGQWLTVEEAVNPRYWARHLRETVRFADGIKELVKIDRAVFVEIGPGQDLSTIVGRFLDKRSGQRVLNLIKPPWKNLADTYYLLNKLGHLWLYSVTINWRKFYNSENRYRVSLPTYPFERRRFWFDQRHQQPQHFQAGDETLKTRWSSPGKGGVGIADSPEIGRNMEISQERPALSSEYIPPAKETEQILANTWQKFFGIQQVGIDDDFFELGGDSLKASVLISKIQSQLDVEVSIIEFCKRPTIRDLALFTADQARRKQQQSETRNPADNSRELTGLTGLRLNDKEPRQQQEDIESDFNKFFREPVVLLNHGTLTPKKLFCFPSGVGYGIAYKNLASIITDYSFYAFGFIEDDHRLKKYVDIIIELQPTGPYLLMGYSVGGKLAFEVTKALENRGFAVSDIILVDSFWPEIGSEEPDSPLSKMIEKYLEDSGMGSFKDTVIRKMKKYKTYWSAPTRPEMVNANVLLILSQQNRETDKARCWDPFTTRTSVTYQGFGEHAVMFTIDWVEKNAQIIKKILEKIESENPFVGLK